MLLICLILMLFFALAAFRFYTNYRMNKYKCRIKELYQTLIVHMSKHSNVIQICENNEVRALTSQEYADILIDEIKDCSRYAEKYNLTKEQVFLNYLLEDIYRLKFRM